MHGFAEEPDEREVGVLVVFQRLDVGMVFGAEGLDGEGELGNEAAGIDVVPGVAVVVVLVVFAFVGVVVADVVLIGVVPVVVASVPLRRAEGNLDGEEAIGGFELLTGEGEGGIAALPALAQVADVDAKELEDVVALRAQDAARGGGQDEVAVVANERASVGILVGILYLQQTIAIGGLARGGGGPT